MCVCVCVYVCVCVCVFYSLFLVCFLNQFILFIHIIYFVPFL